MSPKTTYMFRNSINTARWLLLIQALGFFILGGLMVWIWPFESSKIMANSRGVLESLVQSPEYNGTNPVFEMYTFSLGKQLTMIGLIFVWVSLRAKSKGVINACLLYIPIALWIDWLPPLTWFSEAGVSTIHFPPIFWMSITSTIISGFALWKNQKSIEWS